MFRYFRNVKTPEGEEKTVTIAQALLDRTGQRFKKNDAGVWLHDTEGGRLLVFGIDYDVDLDGSNYLGDEARFVGGGAKHESPLRGDAPENKIVVPRLEQVLAVLKSRKRIINEEAGEQLEKDYRALYQQQKD